jgi:rare lipoprotein A
MGNSVAPAPVSPEKQHGWHQIGLASWYGAQFQGRETANGETFNMNDLTCAHRSLPLNTWVKVTNLRTRKWIVVRVNDRGPVPETRIVDLSSEAAHMLRMRSRGVTRVRLDVIDMPQAVEMARLQKLRVAREEAAEAAPTDPVN